MLTPHYFRHNYASVLYNAGVDVMAAQKFLGHADIKTTLAIYTHLSEQNKKDNIKMVKEAFSAAAIQHNPNENKVAKKLPGWSREG